MNGAFAPESWADTEVSPPIFIARIRLTRGQNLRPPVSDFRFFLSSASQRLCGRNWMIVVIIAGGMLNQLVGQKRGDQIFLKESGKVLTEGRGRNRRLETGKRTLKGRTARTRLSHGSAAASQPYHGFAGIRFIRGPVFRGESLTKFAGLAGRGQEEFRRCIPAGEHGLGFPGRCEAIGSCQG